MQSAKPSQTERESAMVDDNPKLPKLADRDKAELLVQMTKEAKRVERRTGAAACIVICMFEDGQQLVVQDAGMFPMPPQQFYQLVLQAHRNGQLGHNSPKIIKPN